MINVQEIMKMNDGSPVLLCDLFDDKDVTDRIETEAGVFEKGEFSVGQVRECFSPAISRSILLRTKKDCSDIKSVEFV